MRPLITPLRLRHRLWKRVIFASLAGALLLLMLLPAILTQVIRYQVPRMGLGQIEIGNIDLNLFRGKLLLEEVELYKSAARVLSLQRAEIDLAMLSLFEHRLHLQSIEVDGLSLTLRQDGSQPLQIAGFPLPQAAEKEAAPAVPDNSTPWGLGIDALRLTDSSVQVIHPQFSETLQFHNISLGALAMWRPDYLTPVSAHLGVREGTLMAKAKSTPFASAPVHSVELTVEALPLESFAKLARPALADLKGLLSTQMNIRLQQHAADHLSLSQQGNLSLTGLSVQSGNTMLSQQELSWNGSVEMNDVSDIEALQVGGDLSLTGTNVTAEEKRESALSLHRLSLNELKLSGLRQLTLSELAIDGLVAGAVRSSRGVMPAGLADRGAVPEGKEGAETEAQAAAVDDKPFQFRIERLRLSGENRLTFNDLTVKPSFHHTITLTEGEFLHIDNSQPDQAMKIMLKGKDDYYTTFMVEGESRPFASQLAANLKAKLSGFNMPPASPYLAQLLGYRITTGQLDSNIAMQIENNEMKGEIDLHMNQLQLEQEDPARIAEFQSKTALPLNTSLSLLRDKNDNIKLKLPISGKLDDPQFALDDIINTALGKALKTGSVSYLKHLLQPYGSLITVIQLVGQAAGKVRLDPVGFVPGSAELGSEAFDYLAKLSQLAGEKAVNIQLCGFATTTDLVAITKGKQQVIPPAGHPALETLAKQRAERIKSELVQRYGVPQKQLFVCHPELDKEAEALPRVELSL